MSIYLYQPLYHLKKISENLWIVDGDQINMTVGPVKIPFPTRMTVVKLADDELWIHSPIKPMDSLLTSLNQLGSVRHLVSPNKLHYASMEEWRTLYPQAITWYPPGLKEQLRKQDDHFVFDRELLDQAPEDWEMELDQLVFRGSAYIEEVIFFHKSSRTLIMTDLIQNYRLSQTHSRMMKTLYRLGGIVAPCGKTPLDLRKSFLGHHDIVREQIEQILKWHPDKLIISHGDIFESNATEELKRAFDWASK